MFFANREELCKVPILMQITLIDAEKVSEVRINAWTFILCVGERELVYKIIGFTLGKSVDPHHRPPRVVRPVP